MTRPLGSFNNHQSGSNDMFENKKKEENGGEGGGLSCRLSKFWIFKLICSFLSVYPLSWTAGMLSIEEIPEIIQLIFLHYF